MHEIKQILYENQCEQSQSETAHQSRQKVQSRQEKLKSPQFLQQYKLNKQLNNTNFQSQLVYVDFLQTQDNLRLIDKGKLSSLQHPQEEQENILNPSSKPQFLIPKSELSDREKRTYQFLNQQTQFDEQQKSIRTSIQEKMKIYKAEILIREEIKKEQQTQKRKDLQHLFQGVAPQFAYNQLSEKDKNKDEDTSNLINQTNESNTTPPSINTNPTDVIKQNTISSCSNNNNNESNNVYPIYLQNEYQGNMGQRYLLAPLPKSRFSTIITKRNLDNEDNEKSRRIPPSAARNSVQSIDAQASVGVESADENSNTKRLKNYLNQEHLILRKQTPSTSNTNPMIQDQSHNILITNNTALDSIYSGPGASAEVARNPSQSKSAFNTYLKQIMQTRDRVFSLYTSNNNPYNNNNNNPYNNNTINNNLKSIDVSSSSALDQEMISSRREFKYVQTIDSCESSDNSIDGHAEFLKNLHPLNSRHERKKKEVMKQYESQKDIRDLDKSLRMVAIQKVMENNGNYIENNIGQENDFYGRNIKFHTRDPSIANLSEDFNLPQPHRSLASINEPRNSDLFSFAPRQKQNTISIESIDIEQAVKLKNNIEYPTLYQQLDDDELLQKPRNQLKFISRRFIRALQGAQQVDQSLKTLDVTIRNEHERMSIPKVSFKKFNSIQNPKNGPQTVEEDAKYEINYLESRKGNKLKNFLDPFS